MYFSFHKKLMACLKQSGDDDICCRKNFFNIFLSWKIPFIITLLLGLSYVQVFKILRFFSYGTPSSWKLKLKGTEIKNLIILPQCIFTRWIWTLENPHWSGLFASRGKPESHGAIENPDSDSACWNTWWRSWIFFRFDTHKKCLISGRLEPESGDRLARSSSMYPLATKKNSLLSVFFCRWRKHSVLIE